MSKDFNISMICLILNWFVYDPSWMMHLSEFLRTLRSSVLVVFNNFFLIDATARSKISSDQKRFFIALSLYPLSFFANTPFNGSSCVPNSSINMRHGNCALCSVNKPISLNTFFKQLLLKLDIFFETTSNTLKYYFNVVIVRIERKSWAMKKERIKKKEEFEKYGERS